MSILWSFSYNAFVKFHGEKIWEPQHDNVIYKISVKMRCVIKGLHCTSIYRSTYEPRHEISNNVAFATSKGSDQPAHTPRLIRAFASCLNIL